jgi:hypothetical protein
VRNRSPAIEAGAGPKTKLKVKPESTRVSQALQRMQGIALAPKGTRARESAKGNRGSLAAMLRYSSPEKSAAVLLAISSKNQAGNWPTKFDTSQ